jgi:PrcB C-terminal
MAWMLALALAGNVSFTSIAKGTMSDQETARQAVARTPAEWQALWKDHAPGDKLPAVDFASNMVVGVFLGTQPSAGYEVEIVGVRTDGDALVVEYAERQPARGTMAAQILTQPFHLVAVPNRAGALRPASVVRFVRVSDPAPPPAR